MSDINTNIINALNWRYATKAYNASKDISEQDFETILETLRLAPSSFGIQPWKFIVVENKEVREKLKGAAYGQSPVTDASKLLVLCALKNSTVEDVDKYIAKVANVRGTSMEDQKDYHSFIANYVSSLTESVSSEWNKKQVYIALGMAIEIAALLNIDSTPMEGFDPVKFDEILGLTNTRYTSTVSLALGYRSDEDKFSQLAKVRFDRSEVVDFI